MNLDRLSTILLTCAPHQVELLSREVQALGLPVQTSHRASLTVRGSIQDAMRLNLHLRTAFAVLLQLHEFRARSAERLYNKLTGLPWESLIHPAELLTIESRVDTPAMDNTMFVNQKAKDAVCDRLMTQIGKRPDTGPDRTGAVLTLYWKKDHVRVYLNTSGRRLSDRGYRLAPHTAPMMETLAAGVLMSLAYDGLATLVNPMCGSGTLAIEAALIARGIAPGSLRDDFGFIHTRGEGRDAWRRLITEHAPRSHTAHPIIASDHDPTAIEAARRNAERAGVADDIEFHVCDFADTPLPDAPGFIVMNPEYGRRLGEEPALRATYERIGNFLKQRCTDWTGAVFTGSPDLAKRIGLKPRRRVPFLNADIECRLLVYELYHGSRRAAHADDTASRR